MSEVLYNQIKAVAAQLTPTEMIKLAGWLEASAEIALHKADQPTQPTRLKDLYGSCSDVHVSDEDIAEVRREMR